MCWVWQMREMSVFHIMKPSYLVVPERNGASQDPPAGWPQAAVGNARRGQGISMAQGLRPAGSEGWRQLLGRVAQRLQRSRLLSHPPWEGCSSHRRFGGVGIPALPWLNSPGQPSFPPAAAGDIAGSIPAPMLAPSGRPLQFSDLAHGHPLPSGLT